MKHQAAYQPYIGVHEKKIEICNSVRCQLLHKFMLVNCCINLCLSTTEKQYSGDKYGGMSWVFQVIFVWKIVHTKQKDLLFQGAT